METVLVTGVAGNLGTRLLPHLAGYDIVGVDFVEPRAGSPMRFERMDLGHEASCADLVSLLLDTQTVAVLHLAFVIDPVRTGVLDVDPKWQINVAGTARVLEAISEANRRGGSVRKFLFPSSVSAYGPDLPEPVREDAPLAGHTLPYAIHKREADEVVRQRAASLAPCRTYILRPHIFVGASMQNYLVGSLRGTPTGKSRRAERLRARGVRLPMMLPMGLHYRQNLYQFVHVDDMARLIAWILRREPEAQRLTILNVAGRGDPLTFAQCIEMAHAKLLRVPGRWTMRRILQFLWNRNISAIPPDAVPYMTGQYIMNTDRLKKFLGGDYERVIEKTNREAFADSFQKN